MRILQVSTADIAGGAERVAFGLFDRYRELGHESWLAVGTKRTRDPNVVTLDHSYVEHFWYRLWTHVAAKLSPHIGNTKGAGRGKQWSEHLSQPGRWLSWQLGHEYFDFPGTRDLLALTPSSPDIVHCHNLHGRRTEPRGDYFDLRMLPWLSRQAPLMITLHDAWLLSGHCAHSFDCDRWRTGCGQCPDLTIYPALKRDGTAYNWRRKKQIFENLRIYIATPSQWLMRKVEQSILAPAIIEKRVIPNGVDLRTFRPADQRKVRQELGLPIDTSILMFAAYGVRHNRWKDFQTLHQAVIKVAKQMAGHPLLFLAIGQESPPEKIGNAEIRFLPFEPDPTKMAKYYQAADLYIHAARADTFPTTVLEALACGRPVVASAVGGIPEQVDEGQTGFLIEAGDQQSMAGRVEQLLRDTSRRAAMGRCAAMAARSRFDLEHQVNAYLEWYESILHPAGRLQTLPTT
jgi:glycosyltransferase involved in cell wall biosynthesis